MKINLETLYRSTLKKYKNTSSDSLIEQEFLFDLTEKGKDFLKKKQRDCER